MEIIFIIVLGALGLFGLGLAMENLDQRRLEVNPEIAKPTIFDIFQELQGLKVKVVAGAAIDTNIAITGIATGDTLLSVLQVEPADSVASTMLTDRTSEASITSAGNIQLDTTDTTGKQLLVVWFDKVP